MLINRELGKNVTHVKIKINNKYILHNNTGRLNERLIAATCIAYSQSFPKKDFIFALAETNSFATEIESMPSVSGSVSQWRYLIAAES